MRFPQPVHMADDAGDGPVWARTRRRGGGFPIIGLFVTLLALFGGLTAVLAIKEKSVAEGGAVIDGWIATGWDKVREMTGQADEIAAEAVEETGEAAVRAGEALEDGADEAADQLSN